MKDQLLLLQKLQEIDARTQEVRKTIEALPERLRPAQQDLARLEAMLQKERDQLAETEAWRKEQEDLIRREEEAVKASKAKLQASKSAKDFAAASREIDHKRRAITEREQEVLRVLEAMEQTRKNLEAHESDVAKLRDQVKEEEEKLTEKLKELEAQVTVESEGRDELAAQVDSALLKRYETVQKRRGIAVVPVKDGTCQGCYMSLPPQLNNILARFESIENCPNCQRLLYRVELLGEESGGDS